MTAFLSSGAGLLGVVDSLSGADEPEEETGGGGEGGGGDSGGSTGGGGGSVAPDRTKDTDSANPKQSEAEAEAKKKVRLVNVIMQYSTIQKRLRVEKNTRPKKVNFYVCLRR